MEPSFLNSICSGKLFKSNLFEKWIFFVCRLSDAWLIPQAWCERLVGWRIETLFHEQPGREPNCLRTRWFENWHLTVYDSQKYERKIKDMSMLWSKEKILCARALLVFSGKRTSPWGSCSNNSRSHSFTDLGLKVSLAHSKKKSFCNQPKLETV